MKYVGMPVGMWALFARSFRTQLPEVFGWSEDTARLAAKKAKTR